MVVGGEVGRVRVRRFLSLLVRTVADVLVRRGGAERAIGVDVERHRAAAGVVRHGDRASRARDRDVAGIGAVRGHAIERRELARRRRWNTRRRTPSSCPRVGGADLGDGVEEAPIVRDGDERRILQLGDERRSAQPSRSRDRIARRRCPCSRSACARCRCRCRRGSRASFGSRVVGERGKLRERPGCGAAGRGCGDEEKGAGKMKERLVDVSTRRSWTH